MVNEQWNGDVVRMANERARAIYKCDSVFQGRLLAVLASKIVPSDSDFMTHTISLHEVLGSKDRRFGVSVEDRDRILRSLQALQRTQITIRPAGRNAVQIMSMLSFVEIDYEKRTISARFDPALKPFYLDLKRRYTQYSIDDYMRLASVYAQRLFEYLSSWRDMEIILIELKELHEVLQTPKSYRNNFAFFRRRILDSALAEITGKTDFKVSYEAVFFGKKVGGIRFYLNTEKVASSKTVRRRRDANELFMEAFKCAQKHVSAGCASKIQEVKCEICRRFKMVPEEAREE